jgi:DHA2 family multidrug resistance protein
VTSASARAAAPNRGLITASVMLATIMQVLDTTIANVALPHMQGSLSASQDQIAWVLTSYIVASAIMTPATGYLSSRFGRKRLFLISVVGFTIASVLCGVAGSLSQMVIYRLLQGMFGAALVPLSQLVLLDSYPPERHGSAMALWGVGVMLGPILGPSLGGYLTDVYDWRWVFLINVPFGILAYIGIWAVVPDTERDRKLPFDWLGFAFLSLAIGALQMMLDRGELMDWFSSREIIFYAVLSGLCAYLFIVHSVTTDRPFIDLRLFEDRNFLTGMVLIFVVGILLMATLALSPPFLQNLLGYPVLTSGLVLAPRGAGTMVAMMLAGRLIGRVDVRLLIAIGLLLLGYSLWEMSRFTLDVTQALIIETGVVQGFGFGLVFVPMTTITFATLAPALRSQGTALFSLLRNLGGSIGISYVIYLLTTMSAVNHQELAWRVTPFNPMLREPHMPPFWSLTEPHGLALLNHEVTRQATMIAYLDDFTFMMWVAFAAIPLLVFVRKPRRTAAPPDEAVTAAEA